MFIIVDQDSFRADNPSVIMGYFGPDRANSSRDVEFIRQKIENTVGVYTVLDGGQQGWDEFSETSVE